MHQPSPHLLALLASPGRKVLIGRGNLGSKPEANRFCPARTSQRHFVATSKVSAIGLVSRHLALHGAMQRGLQLVFNAHPAPKE